MKKIISILMSSALLLSVVGCSDSRYDALESRVSALEEKVGISSQPTDVTISQTTSNNSGANIEASTTVTEGIYDISTMTADEIVSEVFYYVDNRPQQGDTYETIQARFKVAPTDFNITELGVNSGFNPQYSSEEFGWYGGYGMNISITNDQIFLIDYSNAQQAMNGSTVDVRTNAIGVTMAFGIVDYSKAEEVFTAMGNYLNSSPLFTDVYINRDTGNQWTITFMIVSEDGNGSYGSSGYGVVMQQAQNGYVFNISM